MTIVMEPLMKIPSSMMMMAMDIVNLLPCAGSVSELAADAESKNDCNDGNDNIYLGASESPDGVDESCDGIIDEGTVAYDDDGDGYCESPPCVGSISELAADVESKPDCNDGNDTIYVDAPETPNNIDDDCDTIIDEGTVAYDDDGDGYCESPPCIGSISELAVDAENKNDCNDGNDNIYLGAPESPDGVDEDCDGIIDEGTVAYDDDGDGYCESPPCAGSVSQLATDSESNSDCNDGNDTIYIDAPETPNNIDDDCDTIIDEGTVNYR